MIQPVESFEWIFTMKSLIKIEIKLNVIAVITATSGLIFSVAYIFLIL